ncbi:MAG: hypothetical protein LBE81_09800 [Azonexus sp.]|jgi:hypothetical protein|uniref:hypothetical protein n=1 Tax=Azonexus sp. TaxID=1872668 RepID=UPI002828B8F3|nr:hypothetical protein [Azonexus sp.]MDR0776912.1 hypothetical protein [Azonexus sp.]
MNIVNLIEKYWEDMHVAVTTQNPGKILQNFAPNATYKFRPAAGMMDVVLEEMATSCLGYKDTLVGKYNIERIDELADGSWISVITADVGKPFFTTSFFKFKNDKIVELIEYYGDF